jgi:hypothetical protein
VAQQDVVDSSDQAGRLQGQYVLGLFEHPDFGAVAARVGADAARVTLGQVEAGAAVCQLVLDVENGLSQLGGVAPRLAENVKRQSLRAARPDAGQLLKLPLEPAQRFRVRRSSGSL